MQNLPDPNKTPLVYCCLGSKNCIPLDLVAPSVTYRLRSVFATADVFVSSLNLQTLSSEFESTIEETIARGQPSQSYFARFLVLAPYAESYLTANCIFQSFAKGLRLQHLRRLAALEFTLVGLLFFVRETLLAR